MHNRPVMTPKVLVIVPAYNEEKAVGQLVDEIKKICPLAVILVIDDGSSDSTRKIAEKSGAIVISHPFNLGIGGAVQTGYRFAFENGFDATIQIDGDGQHDPVYITKVLEPVLHNQIDLCVGSRFLLNRSDFKSTPLRRIGIRFFSMILYFLTGAKLSDPTSGFRATGKRLIRLFANYYPVDFPEPEAIKIAKRYNAKIVEVPVNMRKRSEGQSSIRYLATFYYMIKVTLAILIDSLKKKNEEA